MKTGIVTVRNKEGLHLRKAAEIVRCAQRFESKVTLCNQCTHADACSIMQLLLLGAGQHTQLDVIAHGPDEKEAVNSIIELFEDGGGI